MRNKSMAKSRDKKLKVISGMIRFFLSQSLKPFRGIPVLEHDINVGDYVIEASCIYSDRGYSGIGKAVKVGTDSNGWQIMCLDGKKRNWNNASFYRLPQEVQELFTPPPLTNNN